MTVIQVEKRDGHKEDWDKNKLLNALASAGLAPVEAESAATLLEAWVIKNAANDSIKSEVIRAKALELLNLISPDASQRFATYKKA